MAVKPEEEGLMSTTNTCRGDNSGTGKLSDGFDIVISPRWYSPEEEETTTSCKEMIRKRTCAERGSMQGTRGTSETVGKGREVGALILTLS